MLSSHMLATACHIREYRHFYHGRKVSWPLLFWSSESLHFCMGEECAFSGRICSYYFPVFTCVLSPYLPGSVSGLGFCFQDIYERISLQRLNRPSSHAPPCCRTGFLLFLVPSTASLWSVKDLF